MTKNAEAIKEILSTSLKKHGSSIQELETALAQQNTEKTAELLKQSAFGVDQVVKLLSGILGIGFGGAAAVGGLGGLGAYGAYKGLEDSNKKIDDAEAIKQRINLARQELESAALQQQMQ